MVSLIPILHRFEDLHELSLLFEKQILNNSNQEKVLNYNEQTNFSSNKFLLQ